MKSISHCDTSASMSLNIMGSSYNSLEHISRSSVIFYNGCKCLKTLALLHERELVSLKMDCEIYLIEKWNPHVIKNISYAE